MLALHRLDAHCTVVVTGLNNSGVVIVEIPKTAELRM
jgi:hypothetical protein